MPKPRLIVLSHIHPFPAKSGQHLRVLYTLRAAREFFHVTVLTFAPKAKHEKLRKDFSEVCDEVEILDSVYEATTIGKYYHQLRARIFASQTGLMPSNYLLTKEFSPARIEKFLKGKKFDAALFEYWHGWEASPVFQKHGIPTILDTHNVIWQALEKQNKGNQIGSYKIREEAAWQVFDYVIAINRSEFQYIKSKTGPKTRVMFIPMGIDLTLWPFSFQPTNPPRIGYYGGLASRHNADSAIACATEIMPEIWKRHPDTELWIIGSNPPERVKNLSTDPRIKVTGFVNMVQDVIKNVSVMLCPWEGTYGFRSRVVEVMALGVPMIASPEAVDGMDLQHGEGIYLTDSKKEMADFALHILENPEVLSSASAKAREEMENKYSYENTYRVGLKNILAALNTANKN